MPYFATTDNCKLYYEEYGRGKPVVFIHGWGCSRHHFKEQLPTFRNKYRILAFDLRGHGDSDRTEYGLTLPRFAQDLNELISYLGLKDVTLIGWSMGVHVIYEYIKQFSCDNIEKIVLIDMTPKMMTDDEWDLGIFGNYSHKAAMEYLSLMAKDWNEAAAISVPSRFAKSGSVSKADLEWAYEQAGKNTPYVMINMWMAIIMADYRDILPRITVPTLITYGTESILYTAACSEYQHRHIKNSELIAFEKCGHAPHMEDPEKFNGEVMAFIDR